MMIHCYWEGAHEPTDGLDSVRTVYPEAEIVRWTPDTIPMWVTNIIRATEEFARPDTAPRHAANVVRLAMLWLHGGMWVDHDLILSAPAPDLPVATAAHGTSTSTCSCWLLFPKEHPVLWAALDEIQNPTRHFEQSSSTLSGEHLLHELLPAEIPRVPLTPWAVHKNSYRSTERP